MLSLHHSSIADLYFKTYKACKSLGRRIKKKIIDQRDEDLEYCLFYKYMTSTDPRNAIDVVISLSMRSERVIKDLIEDKRVEDSIAKGIDEEEDIKKIGSCVGYIVQVSKEVAQEIVNHIDIDILSSKIDKEEDIWKIESCLRSISDGNKEISKEVADNIKIPILVSKLKKEEVKWKVASYIGHISRVSKKVAQEIAESMGIDKYEPNAQLRTEIAWYIEGIEKEKDITEIGRRMRDIAWRNKERAKKIANSLDIDKISSKIDEEEDILKIRWFLSDIAVVSKELNVKLVEAVSDIEKIDKSRCFSFIPQFRAGSSHVAETRKKYMNPKYRLKELSNVQEEDVVRLLAHRAPGEEYNSIHPPLEEMEEPECSVREMVEPTEGAKAGDRIKFVQFVDTMQFAPITPRERALAAYNRYRGIDCCVSSASMSIEARERDLEKISEELINSELYDTARTSLRARTTQGHALRLDEDGMMFDPMMRWRMDEATGEVIYMKDMLGGMMGKEVVFGKPLPEEELRERTTMYRNAAGGVWQEKDDPESMDVIAEIHWKRTVGGFQPWKKMSEIKGGKKDIGVKNLKLFVPRGGVE